jgi:hypothetical protein
MRRAGIGRSEIFMQATLRGALIVAAALLLCACQPRPQEPPAAPPAAEQEPGAKMYRVDAAASAVVLRVYRDGPLARFGHNHVIVLTQLQGDVFVHRELERSGFELRIPVAAAAIDRLADRQAAGPDFPGEITPEAIAGTRSNMLGPRLLAADVYPLLELHAVALRGALPDLIFTVRVRVRDTITELELPARVDINDQRVSADGALTLSQQQLGLTPFSVLGGGLRVRDAVDVSYHLEAVAQ